MTLYKYISDLSFLERIAQGQIKFTKVDQLNDPTEMFIKFDKDKVFESLRQIRENGYTEADTINLQSQGELLKIAFPEKAGSFDSLMPNTPERANMIIGWGGYEHMDYLEGTLKHTAEALSRTLGVWSLTDNVNSLPMWAYYANNAKGCVVAYQGLDTLFPEKTSSVLNTLKNVTYTKESHFLTFKTDSHIKMFFSKHRAWEHESEFRVVRPLVECDNYSNNYTTNIPDHHPNKVIFGWKTTKEQRVDTIKAVRKINSKIRFSHAEITNYNVVVRDIDG